MRGSGFGVCDAVAVGEPEVFGIRCGEVMLFVAGEVEGTGAADLN